MIKKLVEAGVHFGHLVSRWCPKMAPYIWGHRNKVHLIDVSKTARQIDKAATFLESVAASGKQILWVGTKKAAQGVIAESAQRVGMPYVNHRWIGGTLSNHSQVKKSVTRLVHHEDVIEKSVKVPHYTKKELNVFQKLVDRLEKNVGGIRTLRVPLGAVVIIDVREEAAALKEATVIGVPVVALVDTNSDPSMVDYVIPGNDDATKSISAVLEYLVQAVQKGVDTYKKESSSRAEHAKGERPQRGATRTTAPVEEELLPDAEATSAVPATKKRASVKKEKKPVEEEAVVAAESADSADHVVVVMPPVIDESATLGLLDDEEDLE
jgi:small subunit ribosomal protein S2